MARIVTHIGHRQPDGGRVAAHLVEQVGRVGVDALVYRGRGQHLDTGATARRIIIAVGICQHGYCRGNNLVLAGTDVDVVKPPTGAGGILLYLLICMPITMDIDLITIKGNGLIA